MSGSDPVSLQRDFYAGGDHDHLQPRAGDAYAAKLAACVAAAAGLGPGSRVLEVGAGFGRFSFDLLDHCARLTALDLSERALATLDAAREARGIEPARCRTVPGNVDDPPAAALGGDYDAVVGLFILHHLPDFRASVRRLVPLLRPGGRMVFLEPNRRNPLFALQVACCPDMHWREERGMFALSRRGVLEAFAAAGLSGGACAYRGFFPPQLHNRFASARRLEERLEGVGALRSGLPFLVLSAERPR